MPSPTIAVVILNWNGEHHLNKFLPSVVKHSEGAVIYVVDNNSTDGSIGFVKTFYPEVQLIQHPVNEGFCKGYNKALEKISADYYVLINNDLEVTSHWLKSPIEFMEKNSDVAICQPKILSYHNKYQFEYAGAAGGYLDFFGYPFCKGRVLNSLETDHGQYNTPYPITWASGAAMFIKSAVFKQLGGFDSLFFAHMEEIDLCCRAIRSGYKIYYIPYVTVFHLGAGTLQTHNSIKTYLNYRNGLIMLHKNDTRFWFPLIIIGRLAIDGISSVRFILKGQLPHVWAIIRAHFSYYSLCSSIPRPKKNRTEHSIKLFENIVLVWEYFVKGRKNNLP